MLERSCRISRSPSRDGGWRRLITGPAAPRRRRVRAVGARFSHSGQPSPTPTSRSISNTVDRQRAGGRLLPPIGGVLPPYWVFRALPSVCSDKLPGGYASLGFVMEPGKDLPVGVSRRRRFGVDHVGLNCAVCHTSTVRDAPGAPARVVLGLPAQRLDLQAFVQFVLDCTLDSRLTADAVRGRLPRSGGPSLFERALLRTGLIDRLKLQTLDLRNRIAPILVSGMPRWGRGRVDTFNPYKAIQFNWDLSRLPPDELIGASDYPLESKPRGHAPPLGRRQRLVDSATPRAARRRCR